MLDPFGMHPAEIGRFLNAHDAAQCNYDFIPVRGCEPTDAPVGSIERREVYRQRYEEGREMHHADDTDLGGGKGKTKDTRHNVKTAKADDPEMVVAWKAVIETMWGDR